MIRDLVILGAGGSAGAIVDTVADLNSVRQQWRLVGFLDDDKLKHGSLLFGHPVLGSIDSAASMDHALFAIGVASYKRPDSRAEMFARVGLGSERFATLIHPTAWVSTNATVGRGVLVFQFAVVCDNTTIGDNAFVSAFAFVGHHATVGDAAVMAPRSSLHGGSNLGAGAYAGGHSSVKDGVSIGAGAVVGLGAVVIHDVSPGSTVFGNPARTINVKAAGML